MPLAIGMRILASALCSTSRGRPAPSLPTNIATGLHQSTSHGANTASFPPASPSLASALACATDASVCTPATRNCVSKIGKDIPATIGRCNAAPADARSAFGEYGLAVPLCPEAVVAAPVAPKADAEI